MNVQVEQAATMFAAGKQARMPFSAALELVKQGRRVARAGWNGRDMFIFLVPGSTFAVNRPPLLGIYSEGEKVDYHAHIDMRTAQGLRRAVARLANRSVGGRLATGRLILAR